MLKLDDCFDPADCMEVRMHTREPEKTFALTVDEGENRSTFFIDAMGAQRLAQWLLLNIEEGDLT
jgi:hypothetical protein